jgi:hypothetical protein
MNERHLKPYAGPVPASELQESCVYFSLNHFDDDMLIPILEPLVFAGRNLVELGDPGVTQACGC